MKYRANITILSQVDTTDKKKKKTWLELYDSSCIKSDQEKQNPIAHMINAYKNNIVLQLGMSIKKRYQAIWKKKEK